MGGKMSENQKKIKPPTDEQYREAKFSIALRFCPNFYPCKKCGWPVPDGYCCPTCKDNNPQEK